MNWAILALIAYLLYSISSILSKIILNKHIKNYLLYIIILGVFNVLFLLIIPFYDFKFPPLSYFLLSIFNGILMIIASIPFFKALSIEDVSRIPTMRLTPIFILILSTIFINEILTFKNYIGFAFLFLGGLLTSIKDFKKINISKSFYFMIISSALFAVHYVIAKFIYLKVNFLDAFISMRLGAFLGSIILSLILIKKFNVFSFFYKTNQKMRNIILSRVVISLIGLIILNYAILLGPVSLVNVMNGIEPLFILLFASILTFKYPNVLKEEINKEVLTQKLFAIALVIIGLILIFI